MNALTITWAIITPTKGIATKKDIRIIKKAALSAGSMGYPANQITAHFSNKEKAESVIKGITGLTKAYKVVLITDKQFGMTVNCDFGKVATTLQKQRVFEIN